MPGNNQTINNILALKWVNLAEERLGSKVIYATDDFFAAKENIIKPGRGIFIADKYTDRGKWMDGWESRRKRSPGNDHLVVKLGVRGFIKGFDIDTNHFLGNHPSMASVEACDVSGDPVETTLWTEILKKSSLQPGSQNIFEIENVQSFSHVRLQIFPDGGVARFRVFGEVSVNWLELKQQESINLLAIENGAQVLHCSDMFFSNKDNIIMPGQGINMSDGWETQRRRGDGHDWIIARLGHPGKISKVEVDTAHFKGNYPEACSIDALYVKRESNISVKELLAKNWSKLLETCHLQADHLHNFAAEIGHHDKISHVRFNIYPDGGVSRLRLWGKVVEE